MKRMGIKQEEIEATEVIIKCADKDLVIRDPHVAKINMMGQESLQITGTIEEAAPFSEDDVNMVAKQAHVSAEKARAALTKTKGDLAEAIVSLQS